MTLSATVPAPPDTKSRFSTPRRFNRRYVIQDCSEDDDEDLDDPTNKLKKTGLCHSAPSRIRLTIPDRRIPRKKQRDDVPSQSPLTSPAPESETNVSKQEVCQGEPPPPPVTEPPTDSEVTSVVSQSKRGRKKRRAPDSSPRLESTSVEPADRSLRSHTGRRKATISRRSSEPTLQTIREEEGSLEALKAANVAEDPPDETEDGLSRSEESESRSEAEGHSRQSARTVRRNIPIRNAEEVEERLRNTSITWEGRSLTAYSIPGYIQYLWDLALRESENPQTAVEFPLDLVILRNVLPELQLHRFGKELDQLSFKGIKIRYEPKRVRQTITETLGKVKYRMGVSEATRWVYIGIAKSGLNPVHERRLERIMGRLNLVPIHILRGQPLPTGCMAFLPVHKKKRLQGRGLKMPDSSDEEPLSKAAALAYRSWRRDEQMLRWLKADHDKSHRDWWTVTSTSLDCDGFNDEFGVPAALGFDLKRIQMKIAEALREVDGGAYLRNCSYGDDDLRQTAYTEEAGNDRWSALEAADIQFQYPDCNDLSSEITEETIPKTEASHVSGKDAAEEEPPPSDTSRELHSKCSTTEAVTEPTQPDLLANFVIPKKKRRLESGVVESPSVPHESPSSPAGDDKAEVRQPSTTFVQGELSSPTPNLHSKRLKRSREELECNIQPSDTTTTTSGPLSSSPATHSSNAVMSRECQVIARRKNGSIFFMESFRELSLDIIGRSLWWIFAIGHTSVTEHLLAYHGPTILWNLRRLRRPWSTVVTEVLEDYRSRAMEDPCLNSPDTVERVNEYLTALKKNPEVRHRRLATLKFRGSMSHHSIVAPEPPRGHARNSIIDKIASSVDSNDDVDYNRAICDIVGLRTALFYSKPRFHRMFHETRVTLCKCTRCRNKFKSLVHTGDGRIIRDIESDSTSDTRSVAGSPTQTEYTDGDPELVAELKSLAMDKLDDYATGTRVLSGHSEKTMVALKSLLEKCSGDQCEMSQNVRDQLEECITMWLHQKPTVDTPSEKPKRSRRDRAGHVNEGDVEELRRCFFDDEFFPMRSAYRLNWLARKQLYSMCSDHDWIAPILIARNEKGRAVYAAAVIYKGDFVCEYKGIFYSQYGIARAKESDYTLLGKGSFMFYFRNPLTGTTSCIDATAENASFGPARLINHSHRQPNLEATVVVPSDDTCHDRRARLIFFASRDIRIGEELLIDYGETKPETLRQNAWLYD